MMSSEPEEKSKETSRVFRGFEQLSSSICCRGMTGRHLPLEGKSQFLYNFLIFLNWVFEP